MAEFAEIASSMDDYLKILAHTSAARDSRNLATQSAVKHPENLILLCEHAFDPTSKLHRQACMVLDLAVESDAKIILPQVDGFTRSLQRLRNESAIRVMSRICLTIVKRIQVAEMHQQLISEACFDWLIGTHKVASKSNAIYCLVILARTNLWIESELRNILDKDFSSGTAAYKAATKYALKKLDACRQKNT
jgi:hypothetical protein